MMNKFIFFAMLLWMTVGLTTSCSDDETLVIIDNQMVIVDKTDGRFYAINTTNGSLTPLDSITFNGSALLGIRDIVYNPSDAKIYITMNGSNDGKLYVADPTTLVATLINDNANEDWDAVAELLISNGKLLGTAYINEPEIDHGLIYFELNGTVSNTYDLVAGSTPVSTDGGMGLAFGTAPNTLLVADEDYIYVSDLVGNVSDTVQLTKVDFPPMGMYAYSITSLERDDDGSLFGLTSEGHFVEIDIAAKTIRLIKELTGGNTYHGLTNIPENIF